MRCLTPRAEAARAVHVFCARNRKPVADLSTICRACFESMAENTLEVLVGEKEELYTIIVSPEEHKQILGGDEELLRRKITIETEKRSAATIQQLENFNEANSNQNLESQELIEGDNTGEEGHKESGNEKEAIFIWPDKAVMLFLELYREREHEFAELKRHNKIWSEIASELKKSNYNISGVQVQNKMSSFKRIYKKIKDSNAKSGNHNSCWAFYSVMDSLFGDKAWVSPVAVASSEGPTMPSALTSSFTSYHSPSSSVNDSECQEFSSAKPKKRRVEIILDSFISDLRNDRDQMKEERKKEQLEREKKREQRWEVKRAERKEMHKETSEIQRSLVHLLSKFVEK